jgi:hypothetical protein
VADHPLEYELFLEAWAVVNEEMEEHGDDEIE